MAPFDWSRRDFLRGGATVAAGLATLGATGCARFAGRSTRGVAGLPAATMDPERLVAGASAAEPDLAALRPVLAELVAEMERTVPYASALVLSQRNTEIAVDDQTQTVREPYPSEGAVFTIFNGAWLEEAATTDLTPEGLQRTARALVRASRVRKSRIAIEPGAGGERTLRTACAIDPASIPLEDRFARVVELQRRARSVDPSLVHCGVRQSERNERSVFVNRAKAWSQEVIRVRGDVYFAASDGTQVTGAGHQVGGTGGLELVTFTDDDLAALAVETRALLAARPIESGTYTVVADGDIAGTLAHESFGHGVELDMFVKDRALAEQFVGKRVGSELVNIYDDPSLVGGFGSYFFDHEGQLASPTHIVRDGVFLRGLSDLMSATTLGIARSANGRRQDFSRKTYARMSNTFFASGADTRDGLIAGVDRGVLLQKLTHGMEDPKGWGIMLGVLIGREIRNGQLTGKMYSPVGVTGYVPDVLESVDGVAADFSTSPGGCGKGHKEFVPVSTGGPHIRFRGRLS